ncbi:MAG: 5-oxoprolinase [Solibacterales bacterium]|nr:5-oxoprolinase [Bryobacterales bacterium]|tara:strand:+ start:4592 stop:6295 length:1704 start_codon:yes stop_codon:yes gene_type:complete
MEKIDSVTLSVINNALINACREMGTAMMRTSYSPIFNEGLDFSCVIFNPDGEMTGQAEFCPAMLGSAQYTVKWTIEELGLDAFKPGDVVIHNDPYRGQSHMPEHMVLKPVFFEDKLCCFVGNVAHICEIGGMAPGSFAAEATEVYQEGLRLPPVKIMSQGEYVQDVWRIILTNHRTPKSSWGDLHAMIGSLNIAETRMLELLERYGPEVFESAGTQLLDYSERWMRTEIKDIPNGVYHFKDCMEDDGVTDKPVWMRLKLVVKDDEIIADWRESDPQALGPVNATFAVTAAATYSAVLHVTNKDIPVNSGCFRPIRVITKAGTVVNVRHPGPSVGGNTETHPHLQNVVVAALSQAVPERAAASEAGTACNFLFGGVHPETGEYYTNYHFDGGGWGATVDHDGNSVMCPVNGNCRNTPAEVLETKYPFLTVEYSMRTDSGGAGKYRGGLGGRRVLRVVGPEITVSALMDRTKTNPWGLFGGEQGDSGGILVKKKGETDFRTFSEVYGTVCPSKFTCIALKEGDEVMILSPGGGGYGSPAERSLEAVAEDVRQGLVSVQSAEKIYGYKDC